MRLSPREGWVIAVTCFVAVMLVAAPTAVAGDVQVTGGAAGASSGNNAQAGSAMVVQQHDSASTPATASGLAFDRTIAATPAHDSSISGTVDSSSSATLKTTLVVGDHGARLTWDGSSTATATDHVNALPVSQFDALGTAGADLQLQFTISVAQPFTLAGSFGPNPTGAGSGANGAGFGLSRLEGGVFQSVASIGAGESKTLTGTLQPGQYFLTTQVQVSATVGGQATDETRTFANHGSVDLSIGDGGGSGGGCAAPGVTTVEVGVALAAGCFTERKDADGKPTGVFETDQPAWVGGMPLVPRAGGKLLLVPADHESPLRADGSGVDLVLGPVKIDAPLPEIKPFVTAYTLGLNTSGSFGRLAALPLLQGANGQAKVSWAAGGGGAKVELQASLEDMTKNVGEAFAKASKTSVGTLSAKLTLGLSNGQKADITQGELEIPEYALQLKDTSPPLKEGFGGGKFKAKLVNGTVEWSADVTVLFPWESDSGGANQGAITGRAFFTGGRLGGIGLAASGFERAIGQSGWDLTGVEGNLILSPALAFDFGVAAQQRSSFAGVKLFKLTGNVKGLRLATECKTGANPFEFAGTANIPPLEQQGLGKGKLQVVMCAYVPSATDFAFEASIGADVTIDAPGITKLLAAKGSATGWFQGAGSPSSRLRTDFNLDGAFQLDVPVIGTIAATGVLSSEGYAFCGTYGFISAGFATHNWVDAPTDLTGCDFTPFRVTKASGARTAAAARSVLVRGGQSAVAVAVRGLAAAPRVTVRGPHGEQFRTPSGAHQLKTSAAIIVPIDGLHTTYVYVHRPAAGRWTIRPLPGSPAITVTRTATQLPDPRVHASVGVRRGTATVRWNSRAIAGQSIELIDRAAGTATVIQRATSKAHGTIRFTPAGPLATKRMIEAVVRRNATPFADLTLTRYRLAAPAKPKLVSHLTAKRASAGLAIGWHKASNAVAYLVTISQDNAVVTRTTTTRTALTFTGPPEGKLTITVQPLDRAGRPAHATTVIVS